MVAHFLSAALVVLGLVVIPIGYKIGWTWVRNQRLRISHASVVHFITAETIVGTICPLTIFENNLRADNLVRPFVGHCVELILYRKLTHEIFIFIYFLCFAWAYFL